jgi:tetratricopeptide (TPR) repeat protein
MGEEVESSAAESGDPVAISLALAGASRAKADAFLDEQRHHLHEQFKQLQLGLWEKRLGVLLRAATAGVGIAVAAGLSAMVWDAAHSKGLVIEPFSVPAEMTERGITGEVVASQMIDKLTEMTSHESSRAAQSYGNNWGNNLKVEIPETGVSIEELQSFLKNWLGHDIHISGEVYRNGSGIAVTARGSGGDPGATFTGAEGDLDSLLQKAAEHVYEVTQPYRYANYLDRNYDPNGLEDRIARATAIYHKLIAGDDPVERAWAWNGMGTIAFNFQGDDRLSSDYYRKALAATPDFTIAYYALGARDENLNREEEFLANVSKALQLMASDPSINPHYTTYAITAGSGHAAELIGDFSAAIPIFESGVDLPDDFSVLARGNFTGGTLEAMARRHDLGAARAFARAHPEIVSTYFLAETGDWHGLDAGEAFRRSRIAQASMTDLRRPRARAQAIYDVSRSWFALAKAELGDFQAAEALIAPTPADDDLALRTRGQIAEMQGQHERADWWFARAEARAPHIPFADEAWGKALLARGQADAAIAKFELSNKKGPHFADPLEGWGEALMAKKDSGALAKFEEANKYAPNWGRLHLKWGEALAFAGRKDDAQKEFTKAATLDLTPSEKSELAGMAHG